MKINIFVFIKFIMPVMDSVHLCQNIKDVEILGIWAIWVK